MSNHIQLYNEKEFTEEFYSEENQSELHSFGPVKDVNIVIGANNSRKSRFLRKLLKKEEYLITSSPEISKTLNELQSQIDLLKEAYKNAKARSRSGVNISTRTKLHIQKDEDTLNNLQKFSKQLQPLINLLSFYDNQIIEIGLDLFENLYKDIITLIRKEGDHKAYIKPKLAVIEYLFKLSELSQFNIYNNKYRRNALVDRGSDFPVIETFDFTSLIEALNTIEKTIFLIVTPKKVYIPTFRTAHNLYRNERGEYQKIDEDIYAHTIDKHYNIHTDQEKNIQVWTGLRFYTEIKKVVIAGEILE